MIFGGAEILAMFGAPIGDLIKGATRKWLGSETRPNANDPQEWVAMENATTARVEALAKIDAMGDNVSQWVQDLRASTRYIIAIALLLYVGGLASSSIPIPPVLQTGCAGVWFFLFGERAYNKLKGGE